MSRHAPPATTPTGRSDRRAITGAMLVTLALLSATSPLATDMYLPSFPQMTADMHTSATAIQMSLTSFLVGIGLGQVVFGPLSDRMGRLIPLLVGVALYVAASAGAALAPTVELLIAARFIQGLSGAAGMVIGRAMVSDLSTGRDAARAFSLLMLIGGIAPVAAPVLGSVLAGPIGWRGILWVVTGTGVVALVVSVLVLRETRPAEVRAAARRDGVPKRALVGRRFVGYAAAFAFGFVTLMAYVSASPFLYQTMMGLSELGNGVMFGTNAIVLAGMGGLSARLTRRFEPATLARIGLAINLTSAAALGILVATQAPVWTLAVPLPFAVGSLGLVFGNVTALALEQAPGVSGLASAILGMGQFLLGGAIAPVVGLGGETTAAPLAITMLIASVIANVAFRIARRPSPAEA